MNPCFIGMYGLGVMGKSLAGNLIRNGFSVAVYSKAEQELKRFQENQPAGDWNLCHGEKEFIRSIRHPRVIFLMITAGKPVDEVLTSLLRWLEPGDVVIDGGNSYYEDTIRRCRQAEKAGIHFLGVGVSGGEKGALMGPSLMVGGSETGWKISRNFLETIAAKDQKGNPCCAYLGPEGTGHYVKMVHNGIEYAIMQQIADIYAVLREGMKQSASQAADIFESFETGPLESYLVDITVSVLRKRDEDGSMLIDHVLDAASQNGTGSWCVREAVRRGVPLPCVDEALFARYHSMRKNERQRSSSILPGSAVKTPVGCSPEQLGNALALAVSCSFAQGIFLMSRAFEELKWSVDLAAAVSLWQNGCIIRSALLQKIIPAVQSGQNEILLSNEFREIRASIADLRLVTVQAMERGISVPALSAALSYYDQCRTERMSVNLIQALRDCFGAHRYQRSDRPGLFHSDWESRD